MLRGASLLCRRGLPARVGLLASRGAAVPGSSWVRSAKSRARGGGSGSGSKRKAAAVSVPELCTADRLAQALGTPVQKVMDAAEEMGEPLDSSSHPLPRELMELIGLEFNTTVSVVEVDLGRRPPPSEEEEQKLPLRPPVVTLMGHVDHGKTSLLDAFRGSSIAAGEAGGITQAISAFTVDEGTEQAITFIDTPGHEFFSAMRQRGATATDIVILVVAVNAGVQPTTVQAIEYAREMGAPVIVAANKIDRDGSEAARLRLGQQLLEAGLQVEEFGGEVPMIGISATQRTNLDQLREAVLLQAEMMELRSEREGPAEAIVLEASVRKGLGVVATLMVQRGCLKPSDCVVVGSGYGKARAASPSPSQHRPSTSHHRPSTLPSPSQHLSSPLTTVPAPSHHRPSTSHHLSSLSHHRPITLSAASHHPPTTPQPNPMHPVPSSRLAPSEPISSGPTNPLPSPRPPITAGTRDAG